MELNNNNDDRVFGLELLRELGIILSDLCTYILLELNIRYMFLDLLVYLFIYIICIY